MQTNGRRVSALVKSSATWVHMAALFFGEIQGEVTFDEQFAQVFHDVAEAVQALAEQPSAPICNNVAPDLMISDDAPDLDAIGIHTPPGQLLSPEATPARPSHHEYDFHSLGYYSDGLSLPQRRK